MTQKPNTSQSGALAPAAAFALLLAVVAAAGAVYLFAGSNETGPGPTGTPSGATTTPDHQLSDAEALSRFKELDRLRRLAYATPDPSDVAAVFSPNGPTYRRVRRELRTLQLDRVRSKTTFETQALGVLSNEPEEVRIRQVVLVTPKFLSATGRDVTGPARPELQIIEWILAWDGTQWLIQDSVITDVKPK